MLFTPEMSGLLDRDAERAAANVRREEDDEVLAACREAAREHGICGPPRLARGAHRRAASSPTAAFVIDPRGDDPGALRQDPFVRRRPADRRKLARSRPSIGAGEGAVVVDGTPVGKLGLTICYDLRFPALFARLAEAGAETIAVPAAFTVPTGRAHWEVLLRARAIEAGLFVVAAAQSGRHADGRETYGHSLVVEPVGRGAARHGRGHWRGIRRHRAVAGSPTCGSAIPALSHRRPIAEAVVQ